MVVAAGRAIVVAVVTRVCDTEGTGEVCQVFIGDSVPGPINVVSKTFN